MVQNKKPKKIKKTPRRKLIEKLEKAIRPYILARDENTCQWCLKTVEGANAHVSHVIPKSHGNALRFDDLNLKLLCFHCHINVWHKHPLEASAWFKGRFPDRAEYLDKHKEDYVKLRDSDLEELIEIYKEKYKNLGGF